MSWKLFCCHLDEVLILVFFQAQWEEWLLSLVKDTLEEVDLVKFGQQPEVNYWLGQPTSYKVVLDSS